MIDKIPHLDPEALTSYVLNEMPQGERSRSDDHLINCGYCRFSVDKLTQVVTVMRADDAGSVPSYLTERAIDMFPSAGRAGLERPSIVESVFAVLKLDRMIPVQALRATGLKSVREVVFTTESVEIVLSITPLESGFWQIDGRLDGDGIGGSVQLRSYEQSIESEIDDLGAFCFFDVGDGRYELVARTSESVIVFPAISLEK